MASPNSETPCAARDTRSDAWTEYWATGVLHSCSGSYRGDYGGEIRLFWAGIYRDLATGDRVLDVCCGNGALGRLLASSERFSDSGVVMDAVDAAAVAPAWIDTLPSPDRARLRFHPHVDAGRLPFAARSFDLCVSQYGIEYAGPEAWDEVGRVLDRGGRFAAVVHHSESLPVRIAREEIGHLDWLQAPDGPFEAARSLLPWMAMAAAPGGVERLNSNASAVRARQAFRMAVQRLEERAAGSRYPDALDEAREPLVGALQVARERGAEAATAVLEQACSAWARQRLRASDLAEVAMGREQLAALLERVSGEPPRIGEVRFETGDIAGWCVEVWRGE